MKAVVLQERFDMPNLTYEELLHQWEPLKQVKGVETVEVLDPQQGFSVVGSETHDFLYEQVGERWIFTTFSMVR